MDEQQLQQKERELKVLESNLEVKEADLNLRETRAQLGIEVSSNKQEFLRRAIEVGAQALNKLDAMGEGALENNDLTIHLEELIDTAAVKLTEEISKLS
jgi:hypothetical protein